MKVFRFNLGYMDNNTYVIVDPGTGDAVVVDPTAGSECVAAEIERNGWRLREVLNTHAHADHVAADAHFVRRFGVPVALHPSDVPLLDTLAEQAEWMGLEPPEPVQPRHYLKHDERIRVGRHHLTVIHTPGHTPGGVCFLGDGFVLTGDVLFAGSIGRTDLPGGCAEDLLASIQERLLVLGDDTRVYPGHGQDTTIGWERVHNIHILGIARGTSKHRVA